MSLSLNKKACYESEGTANRPGKEMSDERGHAKGESGSELPQASRVDEVPDLIYEVSEWQGRLSSLPADIWQRQQERRAELARFTDTDRLLGNSARQRATDLAKSGNAESKHAVMYDGYVLAFFYEFVQWISTWHSLTGRRERTARFATMRSQRGKPNENKKDENVILRPCESEESDEDKVPPLQYLSTMRGLTDANAISVSTRKANEAPGLYGALKAVLEELGREGKCAAHQSLRGGDCGERVAKIRDTLGKIRGLAGDHSQYLDTSATNTSSRWQRLDELRASSADTISGDAGGDGKIVPTKYRLGAKIGAGTFAVVYEGVEVSSHARVAVKFVSDPTWV